MQGVYTGIDNPEPQFRINGKIIGPQGAYIKHIVTTTKAKVHLKGKGSNFIEAGEKKESDEPLHLFISAHTEEQLNAAKKLAENLMETVRVKYDEWKKEQERKLEETKKAEAEKEEAKKLQQQQMMNYQMYMYPQMMGVQGYPMMGVQQQTTDGSQSNTSTSTSTTTTGDQNAAMMNQMATMDPDQYKQYMNYYYNYYYGAYGYPNMAMNQTTTTTSTTTTEEKGKEELSNINEDSSSAKRKREETVCYIPR